MISSTIEGKASLSPAKRPAANAPKPTPNVDSGKLPSPRRALWFPHQSTSPSLARLNLDHHNLCTIKLIAETENSRLWMYGRYQHWTDTNPDRGSPDKVIDRGQTNQNLSWSINISNKMRNGTVFRLIVISGPNEFLPPHKIINRLGRLDPGSEQLRILLDQLQQLGLRVTLSQFRIIK